MGLIKIAKEMTDSERIAILNSNMQFLELSSRLRKYPLGMIVGFDTDIDPNEAYGGVWERIKGRFIWGVDDNETVGVTGGEKTHTLTVAELAAHRHGKIYYADSGKTFGLADTGTSPTSAWALEYAGADNHPGDSLNTGETGGGEPHNNMPPYYAVYLWRKTANAAGEDPTVTEYEIITKETSAAIEQAKKDVTDTTNTACANALRGSSFGSAVRMDDISPNEHTLRVKVSSKNSIPYPFTYEPTTSCGITFTDNKNGTITLNGQSNDSTSPATYILFNNTNINKLGLKPNTDYHLSCSDSNLAISLRTVKADGTNKFYSYGNIKFPSEEAPDRLFLQVKKNDTRTFENTVISIQLELGTTATVYTPFVSDLTTVKVTRFGKNLFDKTSVLDTNNWVSYQGGYSNFHITGLKPNTEYTFSMSANNWTGVSDNGFYISINTIQSKWNGGYSIVHSSGSVNSCPTSRTITSSNSGDLYLQFYYVTAERLTTCFNGLIDVQLEIGNTRTTYEPYQGQTYTPAADGTVSGVKSLYPTTTLMTDTEGTIIEAEYNKDINKAFAELQQAIISLGGNV